MVDPPADREAPSADRLRADVDEVAELADAIHSRFRALALVAVYGGLPFGELAALRRSEPTCRAARYGSPRRSSTSAIRSASDPEDEERPTDGAPNPDWSSVSWPTTWTTTRRLKPTRSCSPT
ncbi:MAG: hypothetical protein ACRD0K_23390 [Egibacteraceae bacterium]